MDTIRKKDYSNTHKKIIKFKKKEGKKMMQNTQQQVCEQDERYLTNRIQQVYLVYAI